MDFFGFIITSRFNQPAKVHIVTTHVQFVNYENTNPQGFIWILTTVLIGEGKRPLFMQPVVRAEPHSVATARMHMRYRTRDGTLVRALVLVLFIAGPAPLRPVRTHPFSPTRPYMSHISHFFVSQSC